MVVRKKTKKKTRPFLDTGSKKYKSKIKMVYKTP